MAIGRVSDLEVVCCGDIYDALLVIISILG